MHDLDAKLNNAVNLLNDGLYRLRRVLPEIPGLETAVGLRAAVSDLTHLAAAADMLSLTE